MSTSATSGCFITPVGVQEDGTPATIVDPHELSRDCQNRKRKHEQLDEAPEKWEPFSIKSIQSPPDSSDLLLNPRLLLPRSCLPLAYLDLGDVKGSSTGSRLFSANINYSKAWYDSSDWSQAAILVAQADRTGQFYAIERVHDGIYCWCKLAAWVTEGSLNNLVGTRSSATIPSQCPGFQRSDPIATEWWRTVAAPSHIPSRPPISSDEAAIRAQKFKLWLKKPVQKPAPSVPSSNIPREFRSHQIDISEEDGTVTESLPDPEMLLDCIRTQYLEALYLSRTSLAYFAKGPLSRARASFQRRDGSAYDSSGLKRYLRTMVLTLPTMDKKYRETIPTLVRQYPFSMLSEGECASVIETTRKKARRFKRDKINKSGLYPGEDVNIARWWLGRDMQHTTADTNEAREECLQKTVREQRAREAQLQIIILLETLALEASASDPCEKPPLPDNTGPGHDDPRSKAKKAKGPRDLSTLLDLLADRLCIWQSMNTEAEKPSTSQHQEVTSQERTGSRHNDHLRQFCTDVILPFYGARLPDVSSLLCQKFGGPTDPSPKRPLPHHLKGISKASMKPGAPLPRSVPQRHRRTLERVLTDDKARVNRQPPTLTRSATEPVLQLKREIKHTSVSSRPSNNVPVSKRYTQREVDIRAASQTTESKQKKKRMTTMNLEKELQGAIAAIKRPDPKVAAREFVETVEKRQAGSHLQRNPKNLLRKPSTQDLQVLATPSRKGRPLPYNLPSLPQIPSTDTCEIDEVQSSSVSYVISSSTRKIPVEEIAIEDNINDENKSIMTIVDQTPTRRPSRLAADTFLPMTRHNPSTPSKGSTSFRKPPNDDRKPMPKLSIVQDAFVVGRDPQRRISPLPMPSVQATPLKQVIPHASSSQTPSPSTHPEESDIYASLGWNYDFDD